jgi:hypothetical protein
MIKVLLDQNIPALILPWLQNEVGEAAEITLAVYAVETWEKASIVVDPHKIRYRKCV